MDRQTKGRADRRAKKSYTLSTESVAFLEALRKDRRAASISAVLEEILQDARRQLARQSGEEAVAEYYGLLRRSSGRTRSLGRVGPP